MNSLDNGVWNKIDTLEVKRKVVENEEEKKKKNQK